LPSRHGGRPMSLWTHQALKAQPSPASLGRLQSRRYLRSIFFRRFSSKTKSCAIRRQATLERRRHIEKLGAVLREGSTTTSPATPPASPLYRCPLLFIHFGNDGDATRGAAANLASLRSGPRRSGSPRNRSHNRRPARQPLAPGFISGKKYCGRPRRIPRPSAWRQSWRRGRPERRP
jgi:hypothetical protein